MKTLLKAIEDEGAKYGMVLNKNKCEAVTTRPHANIQFADDTRVPQKTEGKYLGCMLNQKGNT